MNELAKINTASLSQIDFDNISDDAKLKCAAKILGYKQMPPSPQEFLYDDYYCGKFTKKLFPRWAEIFFQVFPNAIETRYPIIVSSGAIGIGKSFFSRLCILYMIARLDHHRDPYSSMGIAPGKKLSVVFNAPTIATVEKEFMAPTKEWISMSPYFSGGMLHGSIEGLNVQFIEDRSQGMTPRYVGADVFASNLSEINEVRPEVAKHRIDTIVKRTLSRFDKVLDYFVLIILDSSTRGTNSVVDEFIKDNVFGDKTLITRESRWSMRKHMNYYGNEGWFKVYCGDSTHAAFIVRDESQLTPDLDPDRILDVPEEVRAEFEGNLITAIQDLGGVSTLGSDSFFSNPEPIFK